MNFKQIEEIVEESLKMLYKKDKHLIYHEYKNGVCEYNHGSERGMVLIRHIERYLTKVGIDMGLDDKITYNVTVQNGQSIIATDNASVTATNTVRSDASELAKLIADVRALSGNLSPEEQEIVSDSLEVIEAEASSDKPKKGMLRTAIAMLKNIKDVTEFGEAVIVLSEFVCTLIK